MQLTMLSPMKKIKLFSLATKYGVQILQFESGYIQVQIRNWDKYEYELKMLIESLHQYEEVYSISIDDERYIISIYYDEKMFSTEADVQYWFNILEKHIM